MRFAASTAFWCRAERGAECGKLPRLRAPRRGRKAPISRSRREHSTKCRTDFVTQVSFLDPTVVLVGMPNVGKSSIVTAVSSGTPEINDYPFTTRRLKIGHVISPDNRYQAAMPSGTACTDLAG